MSARRIILGCVSPLVCVSASAQSWSINELQLLGGSGYRQPNNPQDLSKRILTYQHASSSDGLKHFGFIDFQWTNHERLVSGTWGRAHEFYGEYYAHLAVNRIGFPEVGSLNLVAGINAGNKYSDLNQRTRAYLFGASYDVRLGTGALNLMLASYSDHSRSRFGAPDYRTTYQFTPSGTLQFSDNFSLSGYIDFIGAKGAGTASQIGSQIQIRYDLGALVGQSSRGFVGVEYQYFHNKFGVKGLNERVPQLLLVWRI